MIVYNLRCTNDHVFEEWFTSSTEYDSLAKAGEIPCPECGDKDVAKAIMAPNVATGTKASAGPCGQPMCATGCAYSGD